MEKGRKRERLGEEGERKEGGRKYGRVEGVGRERGKRERMEEGRKGRG